jgi:membrane associated rhomboid family serine protease
MPDEEDYSQYYVYPNQVRRQQQPIFNIGEVTKWLIIICVIVYIVLPQSWYDYFMYNSDYLLQRPWTLVTNAFLHGGILHLLFNCFALFMFGSLVELRHGSKFMLILFFTSVILANLAFGLLSPGVYGLGISAYVYALIGAAVVLEPNARVIFPIGFIYTTAPVRIAGPLMFAAEIIYSVISADGVGHVAHAAGFLVGIALAYARKTRIPPVYENSIRN